MTTTAPATEANNTIDISKATKLQDDSNVTRGFMPRDDANN
ncbi:hypothetical protein ACOI22_04975 [Glaciecola sp. 2405UD65-10]